MSSLDVVRRFCNAPSAVLALLALGMFIAAGAYGSPSPADGGIKNQRYTNAYFGLSMPIPKGWSDVTEPMRGHFEDSVKKSEPGAKTSAPSTAGKTAPSLLLAISEYPVGAPVDCNPYVILWAAQIPPHTRTDPAEAAMIELQDGLKRHPEHGQTVGATGEETIGGKKFFTLDYKLNISGRIAYHSAMFTLDRGYLLTFLPGAGSEAQIQELVGAIERTTFSR
ncbi:MAG TPA: hypothetical protein VFJ58_13495 [Armatimonadota bacterium]|nr:hypothetical protein [Armatimonadota bacterium]